MTTALASVREDAAAYRSSSLMSAMRHPGFRLGLLWRLAIRAKANRIPVLPQAIRQFILLMFSCDLSTSVTIGGGLRMPHPIGIVVGDKVVIEASVTLMQHVTLGGNFGRTAADGRGVPILESGTFVGPSAAVLGPVRVAKGAVVGANSTVTRDVQSRPRTSTDLNGEEGHASTLCS